MVMVTMVVDIMVVMMMLDIMVAMVMVDIMVAMVMVDMVMVIAIVTVYRISREVMSSSCCSYFINNADAVLLLIFN